MDLHKDKSAFEALLSRVSRSTNIRSDVLEKDYYLKMYVVKGKADRLANYNIAAAHLWQK